MRPEVTYDELAEQKQGCWLRGAKIMGFFTIFFGVAFGYQYGFD